MSKETIKTLVIIALCGLSIFFLKGLWLEDLFNERSEILPEIEPRKLDYLVSVKAMNVSFGGGRMTSFYYDREGVFDGFKPNVNLALANVTGVVKMREAAYFNTRLGKSIEFILSTPLNQTEILSLLNAQDISKGEIKGKIERLLVTAREVNKIWIDTSEGYFELRIAMPINDMSASIDQLATDDMAVAFQSVSERFALPEVINAEGDAIKNQVLIPKFSLPVILPIGIESKSIYEDMTQLRGLAKNVFGNRLNFVQEAVDINDNKVFLYGYGDRALRVSKQGVIEYSERFNDQLRREVGFTDSLKLSLEMLEKFNWPIDSLVLNGIEFIERNEVKGYRFTFHYRINDYVVLSTDALQGAVVEIYGGKVKALYSNFNQYDTFHALTAEQAMRLETDDAQFFNMLSQLENFTQMADDFYSDYPDIVAPQSPLERAQPVLNAIREVFAGLYLDRQGKMQPAVVLILGKRTYIIDFYSYKMIKRQ